MKTSAETLSRIANQLRIHSIASTTAAGSGHVTSCCSAAEIVAVLFFGHMRYDPHRPKYPNNDRFVLSKGHAAPILYAAWAEAGCIPVEELTKLRKLDSNLEGHPTPRAPFVDVATGSLGQGLSNGVGMALSACMDRLDFRTYVLLGDGECSEGSVWEAASMAGIRKLNNLVAIVDVNRLGQSQETAFGDNLEVYRKRFEAFGWHAVNIDGHDVSEILNVLRTAGEGDQPCAIIAKTIKGKGLPMEDADDWHGKALPEDQAAETIAKLQPYAESARGIPIPLPTPLHPSAVGTPSAFPGIHYKKGDRVATRQAYGSALARVGGADSRVIALDGDVKNSTYSIEFFKRHPERFIECFIAEQNMVGMATGLAACGKIPFCSTFAAFFSRAYDQVRMASVSMANLKLCGSHAGVSIGEDGVSQMGLEDLAMMRAVHGSTVLYPCDAVSTEKLVERMLFHQGLTYLRMSRPKTVVIYDSDQSFPIGGAKLLKQTERDRLTVVAAGVTVWEALRAAEMLEKEQIHITVIDAYSIKPLALDLLRQAAIRTSLTIVTVEDHYPQGGLGDAVAGCLAADGIRVHKLAVYELPHSGTPDELLAKYQIDANAIVEKVKTLLPHLPSPLEEKPLIEGEDFLLTKPCDFY